MGFHQQNGLLSVTKHTGQSLMEMINVSSCPDCAFEKKKKPFIIE
jgi:hypothetical protein